MRQIVDTPSFTPSPYGLLTTVEWPTGVTHWEAGVTYQPQCPPGGIHGTMYDDCVAVTGAGGPPPHQSNISATMSGIPTVGASPFTVFAEFDCATVGNEQAQQRAMTALSQDEPWQAEYAFWTGIVGNQVIAFPHLAANAPQTDQQSIKIQSAATVVTGTSGDLLNPAMGLGLIEGALASCYKGVGVIHIPQFALPSFDAWGLVKYSGATLKTANGNKIAVGMGYPGSGPDGSARAANSTWMYATGNVFGFRSDVRVRAPQGVQALDRATNTMRMIAERTYVLAYDCCLLAAQVTLGVPKGT